MKTSIIVKWDQEGSHNWPNAPPLYTFLASPHHHIFHFEVHIPVGGENRELEFLDVRQQLVKLYSAGCYNFYNRSCEMIARELADAIRVTWNVWPTKVVVMEDMFCGAEVIAE